MGSRNTPIRPNDNPEERTVKTSTMLLIAVLLLVGMSPSVLAQEGASQLVTIHATETPLMDVLAILSDKSGLNIVASTGAESRVISIHIRQAPVEEALNLIVRAAGLGYERVGNSILVAEQDELLKETGFSTYVIDLHFADAFELVPLVEKIADEVTADPGGNRLVIVATPGMIDQVRDVVLRLDVPPVQVMLETELIEVSTDDLLELGIDWAKLMKHSVIITEGRADASAPGALPTEMPYVPRKVEGDNIYRQAQALEFAIDMLEGTGKAKVLSRSKLATLNNRTAEIHIGDVIPYTVTGVTTGGLIDVDVEKERVGVSVMVTPRVSGDGFITAMVEPNVSSIVGFKGPNNEIPWTKERRARTQVRVADGQTFMIAGLLSEDESETVAKIPLLGDIPVLGHLFRHTRMDTKHSDLIIKITPTIMK
jgi:type II secretory pathway component GspD/PulD (secretin)